MVDTWNYRLHHFDDGNGVAWDTVHRVFYRDGEIIGWVETPTLPDQVVGQALIAVQATLAGERGPTLCGDGMPEGGGEAPGLALYNEFANIHIPPQGGGPNAHQG